MKHEIHSSNPARFLLQIASHVLPLWHLNLGR
jgi:hypothetical protein